MNLETPIRSFPSQDEARLAARKLENEGIPSRLSIDPACDCAVLLVAAKDSDRAAVVVGQEESGVRPLPAEEARPPQEINAGLDPFSSQVAAELEAVAKKARSPLRQLGVLALSLILFVSLGMLRDSIAGVALLVGVLLVHELGHFVGMKLLRYKDVQMFFIPFFGAAVSGTETEPSAPREAVVSLLGPVPGILIGVVTGLLYWQTRQPLLADATRALLFINTFNLLPFHPLDGGRFFDAVLFSRHPKLEIGFKIVTTLALVCLAVLLKTTFLGVLAFFVFISLRGTQISASIAHAMRKQGVPASEGASQGIPAEQLGQIVKMLRAKLPAQHHKPGLIAGYATGIWQRVRSRPCRIGPAVGLVFAYAVFLLLGLGAAILFELTAHAAVETKTELVSRPLPNGDIVRLQVVSAGGQTIAEAQINDQGLYDGTHSAWFTGGRIKSKEGRWKNGWLDGEWKFWDPQGRLTEVIEYDMGEPVRFTERVDGVMKEIPRQDWSRLRKTARQLSPERITSPASTTVR